MLSPPITQIQIVRIVLRLCIGVLVLGAASLLSLRPALCQAISPRSVVAIVVKGAIGVATSEYIAQAIAKAEQDRAELLIVKLDTPGGLISSTRDY